MPTLSLQVLAHAEGLALPTYQTPGSAGMDLRAAIDADIVLQPGGRTAVPTGLRMALPAGHEGQVRPRSGLAFRHGLTVTNAPGTIDEDYRGEVKVLLVNLGVEPVTIHRGMRVAQLVVAPVVQVQVAAVADLDETTRGTGGFGSTGV